MNINEYEQQRTLDFTLWIADVHNTPTNYVSTLKLYLADIHES